MLQRTVIILLSVVPLISFALPIDWHGKFGVDSQIVNHYRYLKHRGSNVVTDGSMEVAPAAGEHQTSSIQSYIFSLQPEIIVNDAATFKAEITTGEGRGGLLGRDTTTSKNPTATGNTLFLNNEPDGNNTLSLAQFYLELYSDLATYQIGRHSKDWGLGALYNSGKNLWDRHTFVYDGVTMNFRLNSFKFSPFWARVNTGSGLTRLHHTKEFGLSLLYDNQERDFAIGVLYAKKENGSQATAYTGVDGTTTLMNNSVKIVDIYFSTKWEKLNFALEAPLISGSLGRVYNATTSSSYKANAIIFESSYQWSDRLKIMLKGGSVSGDDANNTAEFQAMYLNPNYKIANILFAYNPQAVADPDTYGYFDAYVTNAKYLSLKAEYLTEKWTFLGSILYAKANEVARNGLNSFNHLKNKVFTAAAEQKDDLGIELDLNSIYQWNSEISFNLNLGYLMAGDYFAFTNTATPNEAANVFQLQFGLGVEF